MWKYKKEILILKQHLWGNVKKFLPHIFFKIFNIVL